MESIRRLYSRAIIRRGKFGIELCAYLAAALSDLDEKRTHLLCKLSILKWYEQMITAWRHRRRKLSHFYLRVRTRRSEAHRLWTWGLRRRLWCFLGSRIGIEVRLFWDRPKLTDSWEEGYYWFLSWSWILFLSIYSLRIDFPLLKISLFPPSLFFSYCRETIDQFCDFRARFSSIFHILIHNFSSDSMPTAFKVNYIFSRRWLASVIFSQVVRTSLTMLP